MGNDERMMGKLWKVMGKRCENDANMMGHDGTTSDEVRADGGTMSDEVR